MKAPRVYRHRPFVATSIVCLLLVAAVLEHLVAWVVGQADIESVFKAVLVAVPLLAFAAFLVLSWRWRTTIDEIGVTQHWILHHFHVPFAEITAMELEQVPTRWFLRLYCGERTVEIIPCHTVLPNALSSALGPPRTLIVARNDIERSRVTPCQPS